MPSKAYDELVRQVNGPDLGSLRPLDLTGYIEGAFNSDGLPIDVHIGRPERIRLSWPKPRLDHELEQGAAPCAGRRGAKGVALRARHRPNVPGAVGLREPSG